MKCKDCGQSYVYLDTSCTWYARCNLLGTAAEVGGCKGCMPSVGGCCDDQKAPEWDCDLGQSNGYCIHHVN